MSTNLNALGLRVSGLINQFHGGQFRLSELAQLLEYALDDAAQSGDPAELEQVRSWLYVLEDISALVLADRREFSAAERGQANSLLERISHVAHRWSSSI